MKATRIRMGIAALGVAALTSVAAVGGATATTDQASSNKNIVQTASDAGQFKTLISLAQRAGLAGALTGPGKLTVFAPTDKAFAKVPKATLQKLQRNRAQLRAVLLYHVVKGNVKAAQVVKLRRAKTLNGATVRIGVKGKRVYLNRKTRVVKTDIGASNGTIHVIDSVLIPPAR
ncbi:MAG TPA: fasciclin domain-containing protein [Gaiellaceae bacterium]